MPFNSHKYMLLLLSLSLSLLLAVVESSGSLIWDYSGVKQSLIWDGGGVDHTFDLGW